MFLHMIKRSQKEQKKRKKPNAVFGSQMKSKEAKIEKFGYKRAKLATLMSLVCSGAWCVALVPLFPDLVDCFGQRSHVAKWTFSEKEFSIEVLSVNSACPSALRKGVWTRA